MKHPNPKQFAVGNLYYRLVDHYHTPKSIVVREILEPDPEEEGSVRRIVGKSSEYAADNLYLSFDDAIDASITILSEQFQAEVAALDAIKGGEVPDKYRCSDDRAGWTPYEEPSPEEGD